MAQELEVYSNTNKQTYRQGVISTVVSIKKRTPPTTQSHPNVGTESEVKARLNAAKIHRIRAEDLEDVIMTREALIKWGFMVEIPDGPGGDRPASEGEEMKCERCVTNFIVTPLGGGQEEACLFHSGRPFSTQVNGTRFDSFFWQQVFTLLR